MRSDQSEIYLQKSLETVTGYIRGELNLEDLFKDWRNLVT